MEHLKKILLFGQKVIFDDDDDLEVEESHVIITSDINKPRIERTAIEKYEDVVAKYTDSGNQIIFL